MQGKDPSSECTQEVSAYDNDNDADSELNDSASSATSAPVSFILCIAIRACDYINVSDDITIYCLMFITQLK